MALRAAKRIARCGSSWAKASSRVEPCIQGVGIHTGQALKQATYSRWGQAALAAGTPQSLWAPALWQPLRPFMASAAAWEDIQIVVPSMGDSVSEGTVAAVLKHPGDTVQENDVIAQIETDKVTMDVKHTATTPGRIKEMLVKEEDTVVVGQPVAVVETGDFGGGKAAEPAAAESKPAEAPKPAERPAAGAAQKQQQQQQQQPQKKVEPENVAPGAPPFEAPKQRPAPAAPPASGAAPPPPSAAGARPERRVKMTRLRQRVAERLKGAQNTYAMLTTFNEVDMSALMEMRNKYKDEFLDKHGVKLGFMSTFVAAAVQGLKEIPAVNAVIDGDEIIYRDFVDISIAVATPKGLVVPVLRDADKLSFAQIEKTIHELGRKAREGTISIDDMAGGTFTISNGGVYGSMLSTPIINPPQSAIMGMHAITPRAVVVGKGSIEPRPMMYLALTYDHRLIDGREAVTFLKRVKEVVEDPRRLLLEV